MSDKSAVSVHSRARAVVLCAVAALTLPLANARAAGAAPADPDWAGAWAAVPSVPAATGATGAVAVGHVVRGGSPAGGATVVLFAESGGQPVPLSRTTTDGAGRWSIGLAPGTDVTRFTDARTGIANVAVQAFDRAGSDLHYFSLDPNHPGRTADITLDTRRLGAQRSSPSAGRTTNAPEILTVCGDSLLASYDNIKTWIGYGSDEAANNSAVHFNYLYGSSSSLGIGISASSGFGGFSLSGTETVSSSLAASFPIAHGVAYVDYWEMVTYHHVKHTCVTNGVAVTSYEFKPDHIDGGFSYSASKEIGMSHCTGVSAGITITKSTNRSYYASGGANTNTVINIKLSAQTGYNQQTSISYYMGSYGHPWCGLNDVPALDSRLQTIHSSIWTG